MEMTPTPDSIGKALNALHANGASENTIKAYRFDLIGLMNWINSPRPSPQGMTADLETVAATYLTANRSKWAPKTCQRKLTAFRFYGKAIGMTGFLANYKAPKPGKGQPHPIPEMMVGIDAMLDAAGSDNQARALVALCGLVGCRVSEALSVTAKSVDSATRTLTLRGKGDVTRRVPIGEKAWEAILPGLNTATKYDLPLVWVKDRQARNILTNLAVKAGLSRHVASHDLRATYATAMYRKCKDLRTTQMALGHASSVTTEAYVAADMDLMRASSF